MLPHRALYGLLRNLIRTPQAYVGVLSDTSCARASPDVDFLYRAGLDERVGDVAERAELARRRGSRRDEVAALISAHTKDRDEVRREI